MGAVSERLDLSTTGKTELDVVREYLRVALSAEGTLAESEYVGLGNGSNPTFGLDHTPILAGTLRLFVSGTLQTEGATEDYTIVLATGVITFTTGHAPALNAPVTGSYYYGSDPVGADDTTLANLLLAAKEGADSYLNNPFEVDVPQITVNGAVVGDRVTIDGLAFEAAALTDISKRKFQVGASNTLDADELSLCINSDVMEGADGPYGIAGVLATNTAGVIKLTKRSNRVRKILASGNTSSLLVEYVRTEGDIPKAISLWVLQRIARGFEVRTEGLKTETVAGLGSQSWDKEDYALLYPLRLSPGL